MSNINDLMKEINRIKQSTAFFELSQFQSKYSVPSISEMKAVKQSLWASNLLRDAGMNDVLNSATIKSLNESAAILKSFGPEFSHIQSVAAKFQSLSSQWTKVSDRFGADSPSDEPEVIEIDNELYEQMSDTINAIIPDENPQKPEILGKVKHRLTLEQLVALISLLFTIANFIFEIYSSNEKSKQDKQSTQDRPAIEQSVDKRIEDINSSQKDLLIAAQGIADSTQRLTKIAEGRGLLVESSEDISFETGEAKT